ncbi:hypothetical protein [[Mycoplasma] gypis]|uniref:Uncharacterized protein n=1 Tax=[Mycoplasma] gypis TaxID=92404 RepID=A0ABZ2RMH7_9BACT|nr:hypothetical protein [[Mycoplasma] gypis]MBN0919053.1 hypothetical protein [[Mycoplasma] gypis]
MLTNFQETTEASKNSQSFYGANSMYLIALILIAILFFISIKFVMNYKKSIWKIKNVLGDKLKKPYIYGLKGKDSYFVNLILLIVFALICVAVGIYFLVAKADFKNNKVVDIVVYTLWISLPIILCLALFIYSFIVYKKEFSDKKYNDPNWNKKLKNEIYTQYSTEIPANINIENSLLRQRNSQVFKMFSSYLNTYENLNNINTKDAYNFALKIAFISGYYKEYTQNFTLYGDVFSQNVTQEIDYDRDYSSTIDNQIKWMEAVDSKNQVVKEIQANNIQPRTFSPYSRQSRRRSTLSFINTTEMTFLTSDPIGKFNFLIDNQEKQLTIWEFLELLSANTWIKLQKNL